TSDFRAIAGCAQRASTAHKTHVLCASAQTPCKDVKLPQAAQDGIVGSKRMEPAMSIRPVTSETLAQATMEGAGVHLHRAFGFHNPEQMDPFLLFDDFRNEHPR